jgi:hypothetical protein
MKNIQLIIKSKIALLLLLLATACTELKDESFDRIIASQFTPASGDVASLVGAAYTQLA